MDEYEDESFEQEDDRKIPSQGEQGNWTTISLDEIHLGEKLGGGSVGLVHRGTYLGKAVALKTLVNKCSLCCCYSIGLLL